jgi:uncharacterized protein (DUF924 family)
MAKASAERVKQDHGEESGVYKMVGGTVDFAQEHKDVIERWGRFPHRNEILGRTSTPEEVAGLSDGSIGKF